MELCVPQLGPEADKEKKNILGCDDITGNALFSGKVYRKQCHMFALPQYSAME